MTDTSVDSDLGVEDPSVYDVRIMVGGPRDATPSLGWFTARMLWILRTFPDKEKILIIDGKAKGIDTMAYEFAKKHGYAYKRYPAEWDKYAPKTPNGKNPAGMIRNGTMLRASTHYIAFWDYKSRGTGGAIREAEKMKAKGHDIKFTVIRLPEGNEDDTQS